MSKLEKEKFEKQDSDEMNLEDFVSDVSESIRTQMSEYDQSYEEPIEPVKIKKKRRWIKVLAIVMSVLLVIAGGLVVFLRTEAGKRAAISAAADIVYDNTKTIQYDDTTKKAKEDTVATSKLEKDVYNFALIGAQDGNTDTMLIATMDIKNKKLKLTSLMRDIYTQMPTYGAVKLNAVFPLSGADAFYDQVKNDFGVDLDGYVYVDYDAFEEIINIIGGVEIELSESEARYLRTTNYISKKQYRTVVAGKQVLNGNQALGYCRIRYRQTIDGEHDDFGRTSRQRRVLLQVYKSLLGKNPVDLINTMIKILQETNVKTDISKDEFKEYVYQVTEMNISDIETNRIPHDDEYYNSDEKIYGIRKLQDVLVMKDWEDTRRRLHEFIYGAESNMSGTVPSDAPASTETLGN